MGWNSGFTQRKEGETETRAGRAENLEDANPAPEVSIWGLRSVEEAGSGKGNPKRNSLHEGTCSPTCTRDPGLTPWDPGIWLLGV